MSGIMTANANTIGQLMRDVEAMARAENRAVEDVLKDALEGYRENRRLQALAERAEKRNIAAGRKPSGVERAIAEDRREHPSRSR